MVSDAYRFAIPLVAAAAICAYCHVTWAAILALGLAILVCLFFRNPAREIPAGDRLIVSPADGKIVRISTVPATNQHREGQSISIFLSVFNVHVTRSPMAGALEKLEYRRGRFKVAFADEASTVNEQNVLTIRSGATYVIVKQIAGLIARRVVCWKQPGQHMERGEVFGLIRFGSRVDVILPSGARVSVKVGDRVKGGSSIIGELP